MKHTIEYGLGDIESVVRNYARQVQSAQVLTFVGSLGSGKTTFVSRLLKLWGVKEAVTSPTFTYMNFYDLADGRKAYHFDLYRLGSLESFEQAGFAEYLYQENSVCLIEWPEVVMSLLNKSACHAAIDFVGTDKRLLTYSCERQDELF